VASFLVRLVKLAARPIRKAKQNESRTGIHMQYPESSEHHHRVRSGQPHFQITHTSRVVVQQHLLPFKSPPDFWKSKEEGAEYPAQKSLALIWVLAKMELRATFLTDPFWVPCPRPCGGGLVFQVRFVSFTPCVAAIRKCPLA
jgi:hypothetical protein